LQDIVSIAILVAGMEIDMRYCILSSKYQIVIHNDVREATGVQPGDVFEVVFLDDALASKRRG
jgi:hypothetical protein